jgi:hypothetical protein
MAKPNPIDAAVSGLNGMADAALRKKLLKIKGLAESALNGGAEAEEKEDELSEEALEGLESTLGDD